MSSLPDELRLIFLLLLNLSVFLSAYRFALRKIQPDRWSAALDALLILFVVEYAAICLPGLIGFFNCGSMSLVAAAISCGLLYLSGDTGFQPVPAAPATAEGQRKRNALHSNIDRYTTRGAFCFVVGYLLIYGYVNRLSGVLANDPLTYHLNAADHWLRTGSLSLYTTWFFNPANTYSPLAGSTFMAWLIAPMGNDVAVRYVEIPALLLIYLAMLDLCRSIGAKPSIAALIAAGAVLSRPFISQAMLVKDDAFLAAFFLAAVAGFARVRLADRFGPWRVGCAIGLFLATKYTSLLSLPIFFLLIDAPIRAKWNRRKWTFAIGAVILLAFPWLLRNWIIAGNPIYPIPVALFGRPIFPGLFIAERSTEMRTLTGFWRAAAGMYHSLSTAMLLALAVLWIIACVAVVRSKQLADPLRRLCVIGPALGLLLFFIASHAAEIRYAYPSLLLLFAASAIALSIFPRGIAIPAAAMFTAIAIYGGFEFKEVLGWFVLGGIGCAGVVIGLSELNARCLVRFPRVRAGLMLAVFLVGTGFFYVNFAAYLKSLRLYTMATWKDNYGAKSDLWKFVWENLPEDARIAYTNAFVIYPMIGFDHTRTLVYVPVQPSLRYYHDLPVSRQRISDEQIRGFVASAINVRADRDTWLNGLRAARVRYLFIGKQDIAPVPIERRFVDAEPGRFEKLFENEAGTLYRIADFALGKQELSGR